MSSNYLVYMLLPVTISFFLIRIWPHKWTNELCPPRPGESTHQSRMTLVVLLVIFVLSMLQVSMISPSGNTEVLEQMAFSLIDVVMISINWIVLLVPMFIAMKLDMLRWGDIQYNRRNLFPSIILGTLVGIIFLVSNGRLTNLPALFTASGFFAALYYLVVGFAEETLFRGYVQVRWVSALGWWKGFLLTSLVMVLFHAPLILITWDLPLQEALLHMLRMMPLSLLAGYAMHKSGNIAVPGTIHLCLNLIEHL